MMNNLKPLNLLPARERVAASLRKAILSGELAEGEEITLEGIAGQLGVSSTPVREAFQILAQDGLIKLRPNKGTVVSGITEKIVKDHYELRAILERNAAAMVCRNNADLTGIIRAYEKEKDFMEAVASNMDDPSYDELNKDFHMEIWSACGNEKIQNTLLNMWNSLFTECEMAADYKEISIKDHGDILEALMARDEALAKETMNLHIENSLKNFTKRIK